MQVILCVIIGYRVYRVCNSLVPTRIPVFKGVPAVSDQKSEPELSLNPNHVRILGPLSIPQWFCLLSGTELTWSIKIVQLKRSDLYMKIIDATGLSWMDLVTDLLQLAFLNIVCNSGRVGTVRGRVQRRLITM